jgi:hypothetical protein
MGLSTLLTSTWSSTSCGGVDSRHVAGCCWWTRRRRTAVDTSVKELERSTAVPATTPSTMMMAGSAATHSGDRQPRSLPGLEGRVITQVLCVRPAPPGVGRRLQRGCEFQHDQVTPLNRGWHVYVTSSARLGLRICSTWCVAHLLRLRATDVCYCRAPMNT